MAQWETVSRLFDLTRSMAARMAEELPEEEFDRSRGGSNSPKWITGHLALGMDFGLNLLGVSAGKVEELMPIYGPGSEGGEVGDDGRTRDDLISHLKTAGDQLSEAVRNVSEEQLAAPNNTPFLAKELPTVGDLLGHIFTTHIAMHMGQLSQIRRELGMPSIYNFG
ncbi:MAG: DinB family protein [Planctomycetota bacterium]